MILESNEHTHKTKNSWSVYLSAIKRVLIFSSPEHEVWVTSVRRTCVVRRQHLCCLLEAFASIFMQFFQNIWHDNISVKFEYGLCRVKN